MTYETEENFPTKPVKQFIFVSLTNGRVLRARKNDQEKNWKQTGIQPVVEAYPNQQCACQCCYIKLIMFIIQKFV